MGSVRFGVDDIANVGFAISPLWETVAGYHAVHLPWLRKAAGLPHDAGLAERTAPLRP